MLYSRVMGFTVGCEGRKGLAREAQLGLNTRRGGSTLEIMANAKSPGIFCYHAQSMI